MEESPAPPQVSVLIVSHNSAPALRRCLAALERSDSRERLEVIVVDNGSLDESPQLDEEFPGATFLRLPRFFGLVKALNIGMRTAKGEFFFFLAPEVEVQPDTVGALAGRLEGALEAAAVCPLLADLEGKAAPQFRKLPTPASAGVLARRGEWEPAQPDVSGEAVAVAFPSLDALMARSYFLRGLRYIDARYGEAWGDAEVAFQIRRASKKILLDPSIRAVRHPPEPVELPGAARSLFEADWALGAATFAGKHYGFAAGLKVRIVSALHALATFRLGRLRFLAAGQKLDGTQRAI